MQQLGGGVRIHFTCVCVSDVNLSKVENVLTVKLTVMQLLSSIKNDAEAS